MTAFIISSALLFFVLGSLALALPWCGIVHLVERLPANAQPSPHRYALLLIAPVAGLILAVAIALGPWDGNVWEWTETLGAALTSGTDVVNDIILPVSVAQGYTSQPSTDPRLRRYGVPGAMAESGRPSSGTTIFGKTHR